MIVHKIIVLIPTYNECENIEAITRAVMAQPIKNINLLIIDDNSPDGTASMVKKMMPEFPGRLHIIEREGKQGLGTAYIAGFKWALARGYDYIFEMDADFSHNPNDLVKLYNACEIEHAQLAIGSRYKSGVNVVNWPMGRVLMSYFASIYVRMITGMKIMDTTAGFKCYHREVLKTIDLDKIKFKGYAFQIEMKFLTWKYGFHIVEVPIVFTDRRQGSSKMSGGIFSEAVWGVVQMKLRSLFKKYKRERW
ncbi:MAG TPA: dolichyl-phosphate beta-D-mannosyltransferase [Marinilabiliaceae bacterium]|nr:dolichyl-phosphate beta-D-mannosyltransferase [Marinilabiliaceae bacterium]